MISGTLVARPKMISVVLMTSACPTSTRIAAVSAAAAMAMTLSRLITMSATVTSQTARHSVSPALTLSEPCSSLGTISLMAIHRSRRPPISLRNGISITCAITMVKMTRNSTAAPAPSRMPQKRCRGGSERQASAITTALSPESRMLIQMIWPTATQKGHCIMSAQR